MQFGGWEAAGAQKMQFGGWDLAEDYKNAVARLKNAVWRPGIKKNMHIWQLGRGRNFGNAIWRLGAAGH